MLHLKRLRVVRLQCNASCDAKCSAPHKRSRMMLSMTAAATSTPSTRACPTPSPSVFCNILRRYGDSALKKAAFSGHADFIKTMLAASANPNVCDGFMKSPLCVPSLKRSSSDKL